VTSDPPGLRSRWRDPLLAAALYLAVALFAYRVVSPAPCAWVPFSAHLEGANLAVDATDQQFVVATIAHGARALARRPAAMLDDGQCWPMANPVTLGEHMIGEGLLGAPAAVATDDPICIYNTVLVLHLWIPALAMWALVRALTESRAAALVAGFLFAFQPNRIGDPTHPFVHGDLWAPAALLFAHRLFTRGTWADAAGLALFLALAGLESFYPLFALAIVGGVYGLALVVRFRRRLPALLPKLVAMAAVVGGVLLPVLGPYLHTRAAWGVLEGRGSLLFTPSLFAFGAFYYPGTVMLVLAAAGLADRVRGARPVGGDDPRLALLAGGLLVFWTVVWGFTLPGIGFVPSPYTLLFPLVPGLSAVRAVPAIRIGAYLALAVLAGYGVRALGERLGPRARAALAAALVAAAFVEVFVPAVATPTLGVTPVPMGVRRLRPPADVHGLGAALPDGPVLDLPFAVDDVGRLRDMAHYVLLAAYHRRPVAACYNSFTVPIFDDVGALAARLPDVRAADALWALGFRAVVVHGEFLPPRAAAAIVEPLRAGPTRLVPLATAGEHAAYALESERTVTEDRAALAADVAEPAAAAAAAPPASPVEFTFANHGAAVFRHPAPIEPEPLAVRWTDATGAVVATNEVRALLPLALAPGDRAVRRLAIPVPAAPGPYEAALVSRAAPDVVLARRRVVVAPRVGGRP